MAVISENTAPGAGGRVAAGALLLLAGALSALALWLHFPGHVSMDSSMQLYEASLGKSITWNPPYMTAMLRWLGTGPDAAGRMMVFNVIATYMSLAIAGGVLLWTRGRGAASAGLRGIAVALILVNPILLLFLGIVWKDVLFSTFMTVGAAAGLVACATRGRSTWVAAALSVVALAVGMKVRQQGMFLAPALVLLPLIALSLDRGLSRVHIATRALAVVAVFVLASLTASALVGRTIDTDPSLGNQVGFRGLMQYDVAGMTAVSSTPSDRLPIGMSDRLRAEIRRVYSPDRGDFLWYSAEVTQWLSLSGYDGIRQQWWTMVKAEPASYLEHRWEVFRSILNADGVKACLPIHVGIDGNHEHLREIGFTPGLDRFDQDLYYFSQDIIRWPLYRHWVYLAAFALVFVLFVATPMQRRLRWGALVTGLGTALLYASYLPTSIACDFRYLFPAVCLVSLLWIVYIAAADGRPRLYRRRNANGRNG